jgi:hypothetical protein
MHSAVSERCGSYVVSRLVRPITDRQMRRLDAAQILVAKHEPIMLFRISSRETSTSSWRRICSSSSWRPSSAYAAASKSR